MVGAMLFFGNRSSGGGEALAGKMAPPFSLASTSGSTVSLSDYRGENVLLYFSEGVGCDACFYQMVELEKNGGELRDAGITVLPIVMNPADQVRSEMTRFGITTPFLIDEGGAVSKEYGMLGKGMHADLPGHGLVFIDASGRIRWAKEYSSMYASTSEIMSAIRPYLS
ncbi:MAG: peroxiredoxin family protein [Actinobacteria bacterium]|nr:peroxiredoxin family protein [Actinomycetota bacterium]